MGISDSGYSKKPSLGSTQINITIEDGSLSPCTTGFLITMRVYAHFLKPKKQDTMSDLESLIQSSLAQSGTV
jgi:hypothetical protein